MNKKKKKYYAVWKGREPGVFESWSECQLQTKNFLGAQYKAFSTKLMAERALEGTYEDYIKINNKRLSALSKEALAKIGQPILKSIAVDAASSGNPGLMEYRGVDTHTQKVLFHKGPFQKGTNNVGEFLALVHGLAFLKKENSHRLLYTDSRTAIKWVLKKKCNTKLISCVENQPLFELIKRAEKWLRTHKFSTRIVKWETKAWGEIPADFGRK